MFKKIIYTFGLIMISGNLLYAVPMVSLADQIVKAAPLQMEQKLSGPGVVPEEVKVEAVVEEPVKPSARQNVVNYALQFVGGRYVYGGNDPNTGADCSGFTRYVMLHGAGVSLNRSSVAQSKQGVAIGAEQMQPGDLIFYAKGKSINHVALYIGNAQIVHASTYKTGIKISNWNYRAPYKIINVLG